jgi:hypothetical protein
MATNRAPTAEAEVQETTPLHPTDGHAHTHEDGRRRHDQGHDDHGQGEHDHPLEWAVAGEFLNRSRRRRQPGFRRGHRCREIPAAQLTLDLASESRSLACGEHPGRFRATHSPAEFARV